MTSTSFCRSFRPKALFLVLFTSVGVFAFVSQPTFASAYPKLFLQDVNEPSLDQAYLTAGNSELDTPEMVQTLVMKWEEEILTGGKWVHLIYQINSDVENGVILPNGNEMPSSYIEEGWYLINADGLVEKSVLTLRDDLGTVCQLAVYSARTEYNLTFDEKIDLEPYKLKLDRGFSEYFVSIADLKVPVEHETIMYNKKMIDEFSFVEVYESPVQFNNVSSPVVSSMISGSFDNETNEMTHYLNIWNKSDGEQVLFEEWKLLLIEVLPEAPVDVLSTLESIK